MSRLAVQSLMRAAAVSFLEEYAADASIKLQVYPARPRSLYPPTAFVDLIRENITYTGLNQRRPEVEMVVIHGLFDSQDAADQKDAFVDGLIDYAFDHYHDAANNMVVEITDTDDIPAYVPDWMPPEQQRTYYATRIVLGGIASTG